VVSVLPDWPGRPPDAEAPEGSGVVIGDGQWIVTAAHVLEGARHIRIRDIDGNVVEAVPGPVSDAADLALLRVEQALPVLQWADASPDPGAPVCAIGNAFGLDHTVTCGVVSAVHRSDVGFNAVEDFTQTDAAVNPGMSGGALVDEDGRLAGIVSAIFAKQSDANIGVNFAVSIELARMVTDALMTKGTYRPPASGMALKPALAAGETGKAGAEAVAVTTDGAAALAGVKVGDRILYAGDRRVLGPGDVRAALALLAPGENLALRILRDGEEITLELQPR